MSTNENIEWKLINAKFPQFKKYLKNNFFTFEQYEKVALNLFFTKRVIVKNHLSPLVPLGPKTLILT